MPISSQVESAVEDMSTWVTSGPSYRGYPGAGDRAIVAEREGFEVRLTSYGLNLAVWFDARVLDHARLDTLLSILPPGARSCSAERIDARFSAIWCAAQQSPIATTGFHLYVDDTFAGLGAPRNQMEHLLHILEARIHGYIATHARHHVFLHAGVVGWNGSALVLPGQSCSGKSTLVWELVQAGASYFSDEFAVIDANGRVHPFPRPLTMRTEASNSGVRIDLGNHVPPGDPSATKLPIGLIAFTRYVDGAPWEPADLGGTPALLALCEHALGMEHRPRQCFDTLQRVVSSTRVIRSDRGAARSAAVNLLDAFASTSIPT